MNPLILLMSSFFVMIFIKIPISFSLTLSSMLTMAYIGLPFTTILNNMYASVNSFPLLAVPFFLLLGRLMNDGGITLRLVQFSSMMVGHIKGGLGHINVMVSMLFAGLSGSAAADTAGIGAMLIPAMEKDGYDTDFSVAVTAASSTLGVIIPPSIMMVIYGAMGQVSIGALFLAGVVPGLLIGLSQMGYVYYMAKKRGYPSNPKVSLKEKGSAFVKAFPPLLLPLIILLGITAGIFTATEAAAVAVVYGLFLMFIVYRSFKVQDIPGVLKDAVVGYAVPMFAVASAGIMGWLIAYLNAPQMIASWILGITSSYFGIYLMIVAFLLMIGTFLSPLTAIIIFLPIIQQLGAVANLNHIHLGIIVVLTLSLGMVTPPYGICLLIAAQIGKLSAPRAFVAILPLIGLVLLIIFAGIAVPDLFLFLPKLFMPDFV
ncbi:TRAP transporter large permease [Natronincola ferrireducens]|uniref:TRAP transporter, DctM subunit n=1 Tax=Natronincola ferrireducens TaxID=393762 RepID=A0A1G9IX50_9FIRM|nr:TRAP transporter large permease [Natronincola ferrireducens]SDL29533.1 TRAP transporter, DctM subunit [Natronincola ferrireducens]